MNTFFRLLSTSEQEIPDLLEIGSNVVFQGEGSVDHLKVKDNHDGTHQTVSMIKPSLLEVKLSENGILQEAPVFKDLLHHKSPSKRLRDRLFILYQMEGWSIDFDTNYYPMMMEKILTFVDKKIEDAKLINK